MDKQMIEEIEENRVAELRLFYDFCKYNGCEEKTAEDCERCYFNEVYHRLAELEGNIRNGTLKEIPEGAVVLKGTETEEHLEDLLIEFDEMSFFPATLMPNAEECAREWKRKLIYVIGQLRKETAEKFAEMLKRKLSERLDDNEDLNFKINKGIAIIELIGLESLEGEVIVGGLIDEIVKELTGNREELTEGNNDAEG